MIKRTRCRAWLLALWCLLGLAVGQAWAVTPMVSMGDKHGLALRSDGTVFAWGSDESGQLGVGRSVFATVSTKVGGLTGVRAIAGGGDHTLAVKTDGTVWAWGANAYGQLGDGSFSDRSSPVQVAGVVNASMASAGFHYSAVLKQDGTVWSVGEEYDSSSFRQIAGLTGVVSIASGAQHTLALKQDGTVWAWGANQYGEMGNGSAGQGPTLVPAQVLGLTNVKAIAAGYFHSVALKKDGTVWEWGIGLIPTGGSVNRALPVQSIGVVGAQSLGAGGYNISAVIADGTVWRWATGGPPVLMPTASGVTKSAEGGAHSLFLKTDQTVIGFGSNTFGQVGDGSTNTQYAPLDVIGLSNITAIAAGNYHSIALDGTGNVWTWGSDTLGQLGRGIATSNPTPSPVPGMTDVVYVSAGGGHSMVVKQDGTVWTWGENRFGQLGDGSSTYRSTPAVVSGLANVRAVAGGTAHSLALKQDGTVWAWGDNWFGELGNGSNTYATVPAPVVGLTGVSAIAARQHSLALKQDATVWAWGDNQSGQLGFGTVDPSTGNSQITHTSPARVPGLANIQAISVGLSNSYAIGAGGIVWTSGCSLLGCKSTPFAIDGLSQVVAVAGGESFALALRADGAIFGWGGNLLGQLGNGDSTALYSPALIPGVANTAQVSAGGKFSALLSRDGTVSTSGENVVAQLGDGTYARRNTPTLVSNATSDGPLDLNPSVAKNIPAERIPPYWLKVTKAAQVSTAVSYNKDDLNKSGSVYVVAYLPANSPLLTGTVTASGLSANSALTKGSGCPASTAGTVPAVLTRGGWKQTDCTTPTLPLYTGTLDTGNNSFGMYDANKFDQTKDSGLFCVGYAGASTSSAKGLIRSVVSGADATLSICPPIQIGGPADTTAPSIPLNITAKAAGPGQVNLSWNAATDAVGVTRYNIYRGTTLIATLDNVTSYSDTSPKASTAYSYSVTACDAAANCSGQSNSVQTATPAQPSVSLAAGWNLVGNGGSTAMNVPSLFGDPSKVLSIWKWVKTGSTPNIKYPAWAFYTPLQVDGGVAYAASNGFEAFTSIASGEGFWVNAKTAFSVPLTAPTWILSSVFAPSQSRALTPGWSLIATGEAQTASAFNKAMSTTPPAAGVIPLNLTSLWAWQNSAQRWYFYAPSLEASGGLNVYLGEKNYLDLGSLGFAPTMGFWVNRP